MIVAKSRKLGRATSLLLEKRAKGVVETLFGTKCWLIQWPNGARRYVVCSNANYFRNMWVLKQVAGDLTVSSSLPVFNVNKALLFGV